MGQVTTRRVCLFVIGLLYVASVPWYRTSGETPEIWLGLPDWVAVSVLCYVGVAIANSIAWLNTDVFDADERVADEPRADESHADDELGGAS